ncbi:hypothetical protein ACFYKX_05530 [Cytobacillus sp. FJAT-54145]|uniref:Uncharacterized protein n=1 Tax=Cytobacillus spartinae TaxID=3299023 RepID=A0ABW6K7F4_9BACI
MKIIDTVPFFIHHFEPSVRFLRNYYNEYPDIFKEYFSFHCKDTDERLEESLVKYPELFSTLKEVHDKIKPIILEVAEQYTKIYQIHFPIEINLIVGASGLMHIPIDKSFRI